MLPKWTMADIQDRMFNRPLMVTRDRAEIALGVLGRRLNISALIAGPDALVPMTQLQARAANARAEMAGLPGDDGLKKYVWVGDQLLEDEPYEIWNSAAIWTVRGTLMAENGIDPASGATGYDGLSFKARHALANPSVKGAILDIDSGGGEVIDLLELCSQLRSFAEEKPLRAIIRGSGCSAAYALAACAGPGQITAAPYSVVGSIGAIMMHADWSKNLEQDGIDVTLITSAAHKADASPYGPLAADVGDKLKAMVDACADSFLAHVSDAREVDRAGLEAQQAAFYSGREALDLGLIDKFMPWDESMREFAQALNGGRTGGANLAPSGARSSKGTTMGTHESEPAAEQQPVFTQAQHDAALASARTEARAEGVSAERERITAVAEIGGAILGDAVATAVSEGTDPGAFAVAQARAGKDKLAAAAAAAKSEAVAGAKLPETGEIAAAGGVKPEANRGQAFVEKRAAAQAKA